MKKLFSIMLIGMMVLLPMGVNAEQKFNFTCQDNADNTRTCTVTYDIDTPASQISATLTEQGGAEITDIVNAVDSNWIVISKTEANGVWTVNVESASLDEQLSGEGNLFTFTYLKSGHEDCLVKLNINNVEVTTPTTPANDEPTDNKQTGATLPYVALGVVVIGATVAYLATKNKVKMYKI